MFYFIYGLDAVFVIKAAKSGFQVDPVLEMLSECSL